MFVATCRKRPGLPGTGDIWRASGSCGDAQRAHHAGVEARAAHAVAAGGAVGRHSACPDARTCGQPRLVDVDDEQH